MHSQDEVSVRTGGAHSWWAKRALDLTIVVPLLILLLPVFIVIAIAITVNSRGPVIFTQRRVGSRPGRSGDGKWNLREFDIYKFRTMTRDADPSLHEAFLKSLTSSSQRSATDTPGTYKLTDDPRVTGVGKVLRRSSLDELPQLFNVLKGDMSLVGPRPVPTYEAAMYDARHLERLAALPGITGLWQVRGRGRVSFEEAIRMDIQYVRTRTIGLDLWLLILTIPAVLSRKGAR